MDTDSHAPASAPFSSSARDRDWTIHEALRSGVDGLRRHWKVLLPASLLVTCLGEGVSWALTSAGEQLGGASQHALQFANGGFAVLLSLLLTAGFIRITLDTARGRTPSLRSFMSSAGSVLGLLAVYLLTAMAVFVGTLMLIVPGVMAAIGLSFAPMLLIDRQRKPVEALSDSWELLDGSKLKLFGFSMAVGSIALALMIPGMLVTGALGSWMGMIMIVLPVVFVSVIAGVGQAWIYLRLLGAQAR